MKRHGRDVFWMGDGDACGKVKSVESLVFISQTPPVGRGRGIGREIPFRVISCHPGGGVFWKSITGCGWKWLGQVVECVFVERQDRTRGERDIGTKLKDGDTWTAETLIRGFFSVCLSVFQLRRGVGERSREVALIDARGEEFGGRFLRGEN